MRTADAPQHAMDDVIDLCDDEEGGVAAVCAPTARPSRKRPAPQQDDCICVDDIPEDDEVVIIQPQKQARQHQVERQLPDQHKQRATSPPPCDTYVLDNCGCDLPASTLRSQLLCPLAVPGPPPCDSSSTAAPTAEAILAACTCPDCKQPMTHRDVRQLSGARNMHRLYMALAGQLLPSTAKQGSQQQQQQQQQAGSQNAGAGVPCPAYSDEEGEGPCMVPLSSLRKQAARGAGGRGAGSSNSGDTPMTYAQLKQALSARGLPTTGKAAALAARLLSHLEQQAQDTVGAATGGVGAGRGAAEAQVLFCFACDATHELPAPVPEATVAPSSAQPASGTVSLHHHAHPSSLASLVAELHRLLLGEASTAEGGAPFSAAAAKGGGKKGKGRQYGYGSHTSAAPKGTGYGGNEGSNAATEAAMRAAASRQDKQDAALQAVLQRIRDHIVCTSAATAGTLLPAFYLASTAALVLAGHLPHLLRLLLQNDSLQDIASRQQLYRALAELLRALSKSQDLVEVFTVNTDSMEEQLKAAQAHNTGQAAAGQGAGAGPSSAPAAASPAPPRTLLSLLQQLNTQCMVYRRSGEELGQGDEDDIARLSMALELSALYDDVSEAVQVWRQAVAAGDEAKANAEAQERGGAQGSAASNAAPRSSGAAAGGSSRTSKRQAAVAALVAADNEVQQRRQTAYLDTMRPLLFREEPLTKDHYFRQSLGQGSSSGNEVVRKRLRRITEEISTLSTSLPLSWESSICVAVDTERMDVLRCAAWAERNVAEALVRHGAMVIPAADTPYANGFFVFDIYLPPEYPNKPPMVQFLTTGGGRVRFNPNLYDSGKVCLSLLGTWSGPSWIPGSSTLLQVLISIHALILVPDPYFNEPGYEQQMKTEQGKQQGNAYNQQVRLDTLRVALLPALQATLSERSKGSSSKSQSLPGWSTFKDAIMANVLAKREEIKAQAQAWLASTSPTLKSSMQSTVKQVEEVLAKLDAVEKQTEAAAPS